MTDQEASHPLELSNSDKAGKRPTIGLFTYDLRYAQSLEVWSGVVAAAQEHEVNLLAFLTGSWPVTGQDMRSVLRKIAGAENMDGLITFFWWSGREEFEQFYAPYRPLPVVNVMRHYEGYPGIVPDYYQSMRQVVHHLITEHGYQRIAHLGLAGGTAGQQRHQAFVDELAEHGIPLDSRLVRLWQQRDGAGRGIDNIRFLLDEQNLRPPVDFEAVTTFNDEDAHDILPFLQERGIRVPYDVAVVGFDDIIGSDVTTPPLTTASLPRYEMGRRAVEMLLAQWEGRPGSERETVIAPLVIRQSCGCFERETIDAAAVHVWQADARGPGMSLQEAVAARQDDILSHMVQAAGATAGVLEEGWSGRLLDAFASEVSAGRAREGAQPTHQFLPIWDQVLRQVKWVDGDEAAWHGVLSEMRRQVLPCLSRSEQVAGAEDLWQQGRVLLSRAISVARMRSQASNRQRAALMRNVEAALIGALDLTELGNVLAQWLPRLGIQACYLAQYVSQAAPGESAQLVMAFDERGRLEEQVGERIFPASRLAPDHVWPRHRSYRMVVEPLYFGDQQLGFALFEAGSAAVGFTADGSLYEALRDQVSNALRTARLLQERDQAFADAQVRVHEVEILQQMSEAVSSTFDLSHTLDAAIQVLSTEMSFTYIAINLIDREADELQTPRGFGLAANLTGMVRRLSDMQGDILIDVARKQEIEVIDGWDDRFDREIFEKSGHANLVRAYVPLVAREQTIGILEVGYDRRERSRITDAEIRLLHGIANRVGIAVEGARLFDRVQATAQQERVVREISDKMQQATDVESLMQIMAEELNRVLDASRVYVQMGISSGDAQHHLNSTAPG